MQLLELREKDSEFPDCTQNWYFCISRNFYPHALLIIPCNAEGIPIYLDYFIQVSEGEKQYSSLTDISKSIDPKVM